MGKYTTHTRAEFLARIDGNKGRDEAHEQQQTRQRHAHELLPPPSRPMDVARSFVAKHCLFDNFLMLHYWRGAWWRWQTSHWTEVEERRIRSLLYLYTEKAIYLADG